MSISLLVSLLREREQRYAHTHEQGPDPPQTVDALMKLELPAGVDVQLKLN